MRTTFGSPRPSGNHASTQGFQSSFIFAESSTISPVPVSEIHVSPEVKVTPELGLIASWATAVESKP